jgi:hypothetical protein
MRVGCDFFVQVSDLSEVNLSVFGEGEQVFLDQGNQRQSFFVFLQSSDEDLRVGTSLGFQFGLSGQDFSSSLLNPN